MAIDQRSTGGWASTGGTSEHDYSDLNFLIVDDEPFILDLVEKILKRCKAKDIRRLSNGRDALQTLKDDPSYFDIVISDCNMAPINGLQFLRGVREGKVSPDVKDLPILFLSGHNDAPVVKRAVELGVSGFLSKPVSFDKMTSTIDKALKRSEKEA